MHTVALILFVVGLLVNLAGSVMVIVVAFRESVWWGLACIFIPFAFFFFFVTHWQDTKTGVYCVFGGTAIVLLSFVIGPKTQHQDNTASTTTSPSPVPAAPVSRSTSSYTYDPPAPYRPRTTSVTDTGSTSPQLEYVYADNETHLYYEEKCAKRPGNAYRIAKKMAVMQHFAAANCR